VWPAALTHGERINERKRQKDRKTSRLSFESLSVGLNTWLLLLHHLRLLAFAILVAVC